MEKFESDKIYIIGGIVDHNKLKNITKNKAAKLDIKTVKFPISKYMKLNSSSILTVLHVY